MQRVVLIVLFAAFALSLSGCASSVTSGPVEPTFLVHWRGSDDSPRCPPDEECVALRSGWPSFRKLLWAQRSAGLEIVRFDAHIDRLNELYAGAWERSEQEHVLEKGMDWKRFSRRHWKHTQKGDRLVHVRVYRDGRRQRVAAIWRPLADGEDPEPPAKVLFHRSLEELDELIETLYPQGYHPADFDLYPRPDDPEKHLAVGVFRPGAVKADLLWTEHVNCRPVSPIFLAEEGTGAADGACRVDSDPTEFEDICPFGDDLERWIDEGLRPVAFESFMGGDEGLFAILLHETDLPADWLMVPAVVDAVSCRYRCLNGASTCDDVDPGTVGFDIGDLDLLVPPTEHIQSAFTGSSGARITNPNNPFALHNGLVHDGGTSGPPP